MENIKKIVELYDKGEKNLGGELFNSLINDECMEFLTKNHLTKTEIKMFLTYYKSCTIQELTRAYFELNYPIRLIIE